MLTSDFDYTLPEELIASEPLPDRSASRMMVVHRETGIIEHRTFGDLPSLQREGDLFVLNNTRVVPARFFSNDQKRELLRVETYSPLLWRCMVRPGKKFPLGATVEIGTAVGIVREIFEDGQRLIEWDTPVDENQHGHLALPPYMNRADREEDKVRYQTVFAKHAGSIAAPTAGLHFTPDILAQLPHAYVTLHVGVGTFQPVKAEVVEDHTMHAERYDVPVMTSAAIRQAKRVVAVGTTACRTLEATGGKEGSGATSIFIYPGYQFKVVGALLTNFHLPRSTLLMLVSALAGRELIMHAYETAVRERYRFYSYGDCMFIT